ncbi:MAG: response regulator transcription factor [Anaerolineae bacterium]|nr:response regulator transcription factor [Anaerolineae bacterium]
MHKPIRLLIADNDIRFLHSFKTFLDRQKDIKVINMVRDGHGAVKACKDMMPDITLLDLHLPVVDSVRAVQSIIAQNEFSKILVTSSTPNDRYALEAIKVGACGFVEKKDGNNYQEIAHAINQIAIGDVVLNSTLASHILREFS